MLYSSSKLSSTAFCYVAGLFIMLGCFLHQFYQLASEKCCIGHCFPNHQDLICCYNILMPSSPSYVMYKLSWLASRHSHYDLVISEDCVRVNDCGMSRFGFFYDVILFLMLYLLR